MAAETRPSLHLFIAHLPRHEHFDPRDYFSDCKTCAVIKTFAADLREIEDERDRLRGLVNRIHPLAEGLAIRCEILESARDGRLSEVTTEDLNKHAGDTSAAIYAALDRILAETNARRGEKVQGG